MGKFDSGMGYNTQDRAIDVADSNNRLQGIAVDTTYCELQIG